MKTLMVSFQPKWARMILSGEKKYEFRQGNFVNAKTGDKFLILESLGKSKSVTLTEVHESNVTPRISSATFRVNEGTGKVIGEFIVGEVYDDMYVIEEKLFYDEGYKGELSEWYVKEQLEGYTRLKDLDIGYTDQPLAFEITQLKVYDTPRDKNELIVASKWEAFCKCMTEENQTEKYYSYVYGKNGYVVRSPQSFMYVIDTVR
jgi:predicted transcriptional regulator